MEHGKLRSYGYRAAPDPVDLGDEPPGGLAERCRNLLILTDSGSNILRILEEDPTPPSQIKPSIPHDLEKICLMALAKDREERFATARDFAVALQSAIRRAEDQTVLPPLDPSRKIERAATAGGGSRPAAPTMPGAATTPGGVTNAGTLPLE